MKRRAVFLDRDGTLLEEAGYLTHLELLRFFPFSVDAVRLLNRAGFAVIVVSNQSGIARGIVAEELVRRSHEIVAERLRAGGAHIDAYYHCPHHPAGIVPPFNRACDCRKPAPGMWRTAAAEMDIDLDESFTVGDRWLDVAAGRAAGTRAVLVRTGFGQTEEQAPPAGVHADAIVDDLAAAAAWILQQTRDTISAPDATRSR